MNAAPGGGYNFGMDYVSYRVDSACLEHYAVGLLGVMKLYETVASTDSTDTHCNCMRWILAPLSQL